MPIGKISGTAGKAPDYSSGSTNIQHATSQSEVERGLTFKWRVFALSHCRWRESAVWLSEVLVSPQLWRRRSERRSQDTNSQSQRESRIL